MSNLYDTTLSFTTSPFQIDLIRGFEKFVQDDPKFFSKFPVVKRLTDTELKWYEDVRKPRSVAYASASNAGVFTFSTATDAGNFEVGDIVVIGGKAATFKVTAVNTTSGTVTTSLVAANGTGITSSTVPTAAGTLNYHQHAFPEASASGKKDFHQPNPFSNYSQIVRHDVQISRTARQSSNETDANTLAYQYQNMYEEVYREFNNIALFGKKTQRSSTDNGHCGGLYEFGCQSGGIEIDATVSGSTQPLTLKILNDAIAKVKKAGGRPDFILCNPDQRRVISSLVSDLLFYVPQDRTRGWYVDYIVPDTGGRSLSILDDAAVPVGDVWVCDSRCFGLAPMEWFGIENENLNVDGSYTSAICEFSLSFKYAKERLAWIHGLQSSSEVLNAASSSNG